MHKAVALLWCSCLVAADVGRLQQLVDKNRFFELRRDLQQPGWNAAETLFYRAVIASRFGHETEGIELLQGVLAANPSAEIARKTCEEMASAFTRLGRYKDAAQAWAEALLLTPGNDPERDGNDNTRALMAALSEVVPETADFGGDVPIKANRNRLGSWNAPVRVNGVNGQWIFDTGANISTLTETEAKRMGLSVRETKAYVNGSTQKRNPLQLAVASDLQLGAAHIHNVVFLVLADQALHIGPFITRSPGSWGCRFSVPFGEWKFRTPVCSGPILEKLFCREHLTSFLMRHRLSWRSITTSIAYRCFWTQEQMPPFFILLSGMLSGVMRT